MIPKFDVQPQIPDPLPTSEMPNELADEGFGFFRNNWWIGRTTFDEAIELLDAESLVLEILDRCSSNQHEFETLAKSAEDLWISPEAAELLDEDSRQTLEEWMLDAENVAPLGDLEVGVAGLTYVLSAIQCPTAASCRSHAGGSSWSGCPVICFAAPSWRMEILAPLVDRYHCGLMAEREMISVYSASADGLHHLARGILDERDLFRQNPQAGPRSGGRDRYPSKQEPLF